MGAVRDKGRLWTSSRWPRIGLCCRGAGTAAWGPSARVSSSSGAAFSGKGGSRGSPPAVVKSQGPSLRLERNPGAAAYVKVCRTQTGPDACRSLFGSWVYSESARKRTRASLRPLVQCSPRGTRRQEKHHSHEHIQTSTCALSSCKSGCNDVNSGALEVSKLGNSPKSAIFSF